MRLPDRYDSFRRRARQAGARMLELKRDEGAAVVLEAKPDSHVFRSKISTSRSLELRHFTQVLFVDPQAGWVDVEGMISYDDLVAFLAPLGFMPKIVPELRSITVGGAISGVGVEATSFKFGLVHETIREMDVLTGNGELVTCAGEGAHSELFAGMPNSYGVLGYILRARVEIMPMLPHVELRHERHRGPAAAFRSLEAHSADQRNDFVEGVAFGRDDIRIMAGRFVAAPPPAYALRDFRIPNAFYRSVRDCFGEVEYMRTRDYLWRWDADAYWATAGSPLDKTWLRTLLGEKHLRSDKLLGLLAHPVSRAFQRVFGATLESEHKLTQDIGIPLRNWNAYFDWYCRDVNRFPMWLCTTRSRPVPLFRTAEPGVYCDFGTFSAAYADRASCRAALRAVEGKMLELNGIKCFYSDNALSEDAFYRIVDRDAYRALKAKYDTDGFLPGLFEKCVKVCGLDETAPARAQMLQPA